ncbi:YncE family protein [Parahaliea aestuarii]|uniref:YncE family protein n=1 Tax=Parahaliea aestuarii TaxID=1852021 RepID=A0A5C8ZY25_9GAMM|nr:YncE family protein [Parahaliea aestuarii]TXS93396.1 YncE family protein [Parahaliea aestuarii]
MRRLLILLLGLSLLPAAHAGTLLVANKAEGSVTLLRTPGFERIVTLPVGEGPHEIAVSPEGLRALVSNYGNAQRPGNTLTLIDLAQLRPVATIELPAGARPHGIAWMKADTAVVTTEGNRSVLLVDMNELEVRDSIAVDQDVAHMLAASRDGSGAWVASIGSGSVSELALDSGELSGVAASGAGSEGIALVNKGSEVWVSNREAGTISVFSVRPLRKLAEIEVGGFPIRVAADDSRGRVFATLAMDDAMVVIDSESREVSRRIDFDIPVPENADSILAGEGVSGSIPVGLLVSRDYEMIFVAHTQADVISVREAHDLEQVAVFRAGKEPDGMAWTWMDLPLK